MTMPEFTADLALSRTSGSYTTAARWDDAANRRAVVAQAPPSIFTSYCWTREVQCECYPLGPGKNRCLKGCVKECILHGYQFWRSDLFVCGTGINIC